MVNHLHKFNPVRLEAEATLRIDKNGEMWVWGDIHKTRFDKMKDIIVPLSMEACSILTGAID